MYRGGRWKGKGVSTIEGILLDIETFATSVTVLLGLVLLAIGACGILLGYLADEEASGKRIFWAESPFTDVGATEAPAEGVLVSPGGVTPSRTICGRGIAEWSNPPAGTGAGIL